MLIHEFAGRTLFGRKSKRHRQLDTLRANVRRGRAAEEQFEWAQRMSGNEVERTGRGSDYRVRKVDPWTGRKGKAKLYEVKSSKTAPVSKLQRKSRARKVVIEPLFY